MLLFLEQMRWGTGAKRESKLSLGKSRLLYGQTLPSTITS